MNERIMKLAVQAGYNMHYATEEFDVDAFAELIVKECLTLCNHDPNDDEYDYFDMGMTTKARVIREKIKKHFGVE